MAVHIISDDYFFSLGARKSLQILLRKSDFMDVYSVHLENSSLLPLYNVQLNPKDICVIAIENDDVCEQACKFIKINTKNVIFIFDAAEKLILENTKMNGRVFSKKREASLFLGDVILVGLGRSRLSPLMSLAEDNSPVIDMLFSEEQVNKIASVLDVTQKNIYSKKDYYLKKYGFQSSSTHGLYFMKRVVRNCRALFIE